MPGDNGRPDHRRHRADARSGRRVRTGAARHVERVVDRPLVRRPALSEQVAARPGRGSVPLSTLVRPRGAAPPGRALDHPGLRPGGLRLRGGARPSRRDPTRGGSHRTRSSPPGTRRPTSSSASRSTKGSASRSSRPWPRGCRSWPTTPARWGRRSGERVSFSTPSDRVSSPRPSPGWHATRCSRARCRRPADSDSAPSHRTRPARASSKCSVPSRVYDGRPYEAHLCDPALWHRSHRWGRDRGADAGRTARPTARLGGRGPDQLRTRPPDVGERRAGWHFDDQRGHRAPLPDRDPTPARLLRARRTSAGLADHRLPRGGSAVDRTQRSALPGARGRGRRHTFRRARLLPVPLRDHGRRHRGVPGADRAPSGRSRRARALSAGLPAQLLGPRRLRVPHPCGARPDGARLPGRGSPATGARPRRRRTRRNRSGRRGPARALRPALPLLSGTGRRAQGLRHAG